MQEKKIIIRSNREDICVPVNQILYVIMNRNIAEIHLSTEKIYETRITLTELQEKLGSDFVLVHRSILVSVMAIHDVSDLIHLYNGETLEYVTRRKKQIRDQVYEKRKEIVGGFPKDNIPRTEEEYCEYFRGFEHMPFAFTDIEMVFNHKQQAVDWVFRYGNQALARLEKLPLSQMIGNSFGSLFANMDAKWLFSYERATLYGETREIIDYSPEIDTYLKVICFPTFPGHCGCILFNINEIEFTRNSSDAEKALKLYLQENA